MLLRDLDHSETDQNTLSLLRNWVRHGDEKAIKEFFNKANPYKIAEWIGHERKKIQIALFRALDLPLATEVFDYLPPRLQKRFLYSVSQDQAGRLLAALSSDDRTAFLQEMPRSVINDLLKFLPVDVKTETLTLLGYPKGSIGRLMTPNYLAIKSDWTVEKVMDHLLEHGHDSETLTLLYVVDDQGKLIDDIRLRDLLFVPRTDTVESLMDHQFIALQVDDDDETAIAIFRRYDRTALPVVDHNGMLLGIVTIDDVLRLSDREATEDIQKIGGQEALDEPYMDIPFLTLMKKRAGWLVVLFLGEMLTATALSYFEVQISKAVVLALFLPLIISSGGNAGSQATTLIIRAMALGEVKLRDWWRVIRRELASGLFLGIILGAVGFARIALWSQFSTIYGEHWILVAWTIFFALIGVVLWGTLSGAVFPLILRFLKIDPATSSAPFVATAVDVTGIIIYFLTAITILSGTLL